MSVTFKLRYWVEMDCLLLQCILTFDVLPWIIHSGVRAHCGRELVSRFVTSTPIGTDMLKEICEISKMELRWKEGLFNSVNKFLTCVKKKRKHAFWSVNEIADKLI